MNLDNFEKYNNVESKLVYSNCVSNGDIKLSICIPTKNRTTLLVQTLKSIAANKFQEDVEIIVCDNAFNESSINDIKAVNLKNIKYYANSNDIGMFGNWNRLISLAKGKWVSFIHDDDLLDKNYLKKVKKALKNINPSVGYIKANHIEFCDGSGSVKTISRKDRIKYLLNKLRVNSINYISIEEVALFGNGGFIGAPTCGTLINKDIAIQVGGFDEELYPSADSYFPIKMLKNGFLVGKSTKIFGYYRLFENESYNPKTIDLFLKDFPNQRKFISDCSSNTKTIIDYYRDEQFFEFINKFILKMMKKENDLTTRDALLKQFDVQFSSEKYKSYSKIKKKCILLHYFGIDNYAKRSRL